MKVIAAVFLTFFVGSGPADVPVGQWTYGLAAGGGSVWAGSLTTGQVLRVDPDSGKVLRKVDAGVRTFNLAASPGAVWAVGNTSSTVARIDTRTGGVKTITVGLAPFDVEWGFGSAWVANGGDGTVWRITGGRVVEKIRIGIEPNGLTAYRGALWVSDHTLGKVVRVDPVSNRVTGRVAVTGADWIVGRGGFLYVSQETNRVAKVDIRTLKVVAWVATGRNPLGSAFVGGRLWVPCIDSAEIDVVDPATMRIVARKRTAPSPIVVLPAFGHVWVSHATGNAVTRY